jgi:hypothetical protein
MVDDLILNSPADRQSPGQRQPSLFISSMTPGSILVGDPTVSIAGTSGQPEPKALDLRIQGLGVV